MSNTVELLKKSGYSEKAIEYFVKKTNLGKIENASVFSSYTGPCGDAMEIYLEIKDNIIKQAKFQTTGCAGALVSGSAICDMINGMTISKAGKIKTEDIVKHLGDMPGIKVHCSRLAKRTLRKVIEKYLKV